MNIVFLTSGTTGVGRLVFGISIFNSLYRKKIDTDFVILHSSPDNRAAVLDKFNIKNRQLAVEGGNSLLTDSYKASRLFSSLQDINPDILIVDRIWMSVYRILDELKCRKVFICSQIAPAFFTINTPSIQISFNDKQYDKIVAIEPFNSPFKMEQVNPLIIRNKDEILTKEDALVKLGLDGSKKVCFIGMNYKPGYFEELKTKYSCMEDQGEYDIVYSTNIEGKGIFPIADYYNAVDLLICPATYNHFWESRFFNKETVFVPAPVRFCNPEERIKKFSDYTFKKNGADQLVEMLMNL